MPRQNRVTPFGDIVAMPERGTFLGNRGILHDEEAHIRRAWQVKRWLVCVLEFKGIRRKIMSPNSYTELFFLDEVTAFAAGHRPCAECRYRRFFAFCQAWAKSYPTVDGSRPKVDAIDGRLHAERLGPGRRKRTYETRLDDLPDGVLVTTLAKADEALLVLGGQLLTWTPAGYGKRRARVKGEMVNVLTPPSTVQAIRDGYAPEIHASAFRRGGKQSASRR